MAFIGREYVKKFDKNKQFKEYILVEKNPLVIDFSRKEHTFIVGKSGSGKSYLAGVIAEELIKTISNYSVIILDPIGIFSTLSEKNNSDEVQEWNQLMNRREIIPEGMKNYTVWIPAGDLENFKPYMYDRIFSLKAENITASTLCFAFDMGPLDPQVRLFSKGRSLLKKEIPNFELSELKSYIVENGKDELHYKDQTIEALISKLDALEELGVINSKHGIEIHEVVKEGEVVIFDLSMGSQYTARIIVNFFAEQLLIQRKRITRILREAQKDGQKKFISDYIPPVQMVIDEAHNFLPKNIVLKKYIKEGRNAGCMLTAISQSPDLTRDVYANIVHLFVGQLIFTDDIEKVKKMLPIEKTTKQFREQIKQLNVGCFYYYNIDKKTEKKIRVRPRLTLHPATTELRDERKYLILQKEFENKFLKLIGKDTVQITDIPLEYMEIIPDLVKDDRIRMTDKYIAKRLKGVKN